LRPKKCGAGAGLNCAGAGKISQTPAGAGRVYFFAKEGNLISVAESTFHNLRLPTPTFPQSLTKVDVFSNRQMRSHSGITFLFISNEKLRNVMLTCRRSKTITLLKTS